MTMAVFPKESFPKKAILQDMESNCGFLHRLDVPNSGLLLLATSYAAYYDLQLQLAAGQLIRDYLVLVHGVASHRSLLARLQRQAERSIAGGQGKSSCTKVLKIAKDIRDQSWRLSFQVEIGMKVRTWWILLLGNLVHTLRCLHFDALADCYGTTTSNSMPPGTCWAFSCLRALA